MRVLNVCRYNQARSIVSGALLRKLYPQLEVSTAGIEALSGRQVPGITLDLCAQWGLDEYDRTSRNIADIDRQVRAGHFDVIIAADELVKSRILETGVTTPIVALTELAEPSLTPPVDPTGFANEAFHEELAKVALLTVRWADGFLNITRPEIVGKIIHLSLLGKRDFHQSNDGSPELSLDTELGRPSPEIWRAQGYHVEFFNPRNLSSALPLNLAALGENPKTILVSRFEIDLPGHIYSSLQWRDFILSLAEESPSALVLVTTSSPEIRPSDMILSLLHSSELEIYGRE